MERNSKSYYMWTVHCKLLSLLPGSHSDLVISFPLDFIALFFLIQHGTDNKNLTVLYIKAKFTHFSTLYWRACFLNQAVNVFHSDQLSFSIKTTDTVRYLLREQSQFYALAAQADILAPREYNLECAAVQYIKAWLNIWQLGW